MDFEDRILIQGTNCTSCGSQYTGFTINGISWLPYVVRAGDRLMLRQKTNSGLGGVVLYFSDGSSTRNVATDSDGQLLNSDGMTGYFHYRTSDLSAYAGKTLTSIAVISETTSGAGSWLLKFADFVLISTDGTVQPIYTNETTASLTQFGTSGVTGVSGGVDHVSNSSDPTNTTWYYHGDQIGSSRLMSANEGWPVWQGTFLPYGEEYNPQITTNHYKFTGKERDSETGLDYFGARYYGNALGRWMTPDWAAKATTVPYANFGNPQTLNLYTYAKNNPTTLSDPDGHGLIDWERVTEAIGNASKSFAKSFGLGVAKEVHNMTANAASHMLPAVGESMGYTGMQTGSPTDPAKRPVLEKPENAGEAIGMAATLVAPAVAPALSEIRAVEVIEVTDVASVIHFTSDAGVDGITASDGVLRAGTYVTTPGEIPAGSSSSEIESLLEIGPGKGANSVTFETPNSNLTVPENGPTTSGGAQQFQLKEPTKVDPSTFTKTDPK